VDECSNPSIRLETHARIVPLALEYEARLYEALTGEECRQFEALSDRLFIHAQTLRRNR
jgi:hypothetical protein